MAIQLELNILDWHRNKIVYIGFMVMMSIYRISYYETTQNI